MASGPRASARARRRTEAEDDVRALRIRHVLQALLELLDEVGRRRDDCGRSATAAVSAQRGRPRSRKRATALAPLSVARSGSHRVARKTACAFGVSARPNAASSSAVRTRPLSGAERTRPHIAHIARARRASREFLGPDPHPAPFCPPRAVEEGQVLVPLTLPVHDEAPVGVLRAARHPRASSGRTAHRLPSERREAFKL